MKILYFTVFNEMSLAEAEGNKENLIQQQGANGTKTLKVYILDTYLFRSECTSTHNQLDLSFIERSISIVHLIVNFIARTLSKSRINSLCSLWIEGYVFIHSVYRRNRSTQQLETLDIHHIISTTMIINSMVNKGNKYIENTFYISISSSIRRAN